MKTIAKKTKKVTKGFDFYTKISSIQDLLHVNINAKRDITLGEYLTQKGYPSFAQMLKE